ncbi:MAG: hypothetical protein HeimC2_29780 [Candidatus Heimdallarchaeota archaeon LC_2]|nr:MAG: hypothetical protein HeimC2_29780 [Candidatus Heimdallarchaeota archaeon LC_2]
MTESENPMLKKVLGYLDEFEWQPENVEDKDGQVTITLVAQLEIREMSITIKFSEDSHWIYFSALFIPTVANNLENVYKKLLEINYSTTLTKFGLSSNGSIYALTELPSKTLDYDEFLSALRRLTNDVNTFFMPIANLVKTNNDDEEEED